MATSDKISGDHRQSKKGKSLEDLVAKLERVLAGQGVLIEAPKKLRDKVTKKLREHDVVLTFNQGHHRMITALECRDRSRHVGVEQVEAFHTKCQHTGIDKGVIVSPTGFTKTARAKAEHCGIRCLDLKFVERFDWLLGQEMQVATIGLGPNCHFTCIPAEPLDPKPTEFEILNEKGGLVSHSNLLNNVRLNLGRLHHLPAGNRQQGIRFATPGYRLRDRATGRTCALARIDAVADVIVTTTKAPFQLVSYEDLNNPTKVIAQTAFAPITSGEIQGDFVLSQKPGQGTDVKFVIRAIGSSASPKTDACPETTFKTPADSPDPGAKGS
jgi:hypothetical protein